MSNVLPMGSLQAPLPGKRKCDNWLQSFIEYASFGEAPMKTLFWTGVSTLAGALQRKVFIDMGYFQFIPNFYIILVAPPGIISKSTTANIGMNLLREAKVARFGPDVVTWQALVQSMAENKEAYIDPENGEMNEQCAVTICSDEFGNLLDPQNREMVDIFVSLWDGKRGTFEKKTKNSGNDLIVNPWVNIIACTTPSWISGNLPDYIIGGGFTSRSLWVYADEKRQLVAYPKRGMDERNEVLRRALISDLVEINKIVGEFKLTEEAFEWGTDWYARHYSNKHEHLNQEQFAGYLARKQVHMHKLAMVIAASAGNDLRLEVKHLVEADQLITSLEADMNKVFEGIGQNPVTKMASDIRKVIEARGPMKKDEAFRFVYRTMSYDDFESALNSAIQAKMLVLRNIGNQSMLDLGETTPAPPPAVQVQAY